MDQFIGQIILFAGNFAPRGWALCDGQLLPISTNTALFSIIGTIYGGDGRTTFGLPDLRGGAENHTLSNQEMPSHTHSGAIKVSNTTANDDTPGAGSSIGTSEIFVDGAANTTLAPNSLQIGETGGNQQFNLRNPYTAVNYIIAVQGIFPSRSQ